MLDHDDQLLQPGDAVIIPARIVRVLDTVHSVEVRLENVNRTLFLDSRSVVRVNEPKEER